VDAGHDRAEQGGVTSDDLARAFQQERARLLRVAYRMLGSVADAEDVVQEAFIRWMSADRAGVREPEAYLRRTVTRLCLDQLKSAQHRRETYIGPWLPEPVVEEEADEDVTLPLMLALERLSPLERAAFLLHDVFGVGFDEIAGTIGRDAAACRQLAARARAHVREARPRFQVEKRRGLEIAHAFFAASRSGDMSALGALLAADVSIHSDGGGKRPAAPQVILGFDHVMKLHKALGVLCRKYPSTLLRTAMVNGLPGFVTREADGELQTTALQIEDGKVTAIYVMRNPDKLRHLH
jgi:RNA polymerase sigma-70 factor (ECF subfamily)